MQRCGVRRNVQVKMLFVCVAQVNVVLRQYYHQRHEAFLATLKRVFIIPLGYNADLFVGKSSVLAAKASLLVPSKSRQYVQVENQ
jgi:hypothetical protein